MVIKISADTEENEDIDELEPFVQNENFPVGGSVDPELTGKLTAEQARNLVSDYADSGTNIEVPVEVGIVDTLIEWRPGVSAVDIYLEGEYNNKRGLAYQLLSKATPFESTRTEAYHDSFSVKDASWDDYNEIRSKYGLE